MKKISLAVLTAIFSITFTSAQVGIQAGYGIQTRTFENSWMNTFFGDKTTLTGFHVGPVADLNVQGPISLQYGIFYNYLTANKDFLVGDVKITSHSLNLPVRVKASIPFGEGLSAFVFAGPNFNYAVAEVYDVNETRFKLPGQDNESIYTWEGLEDEKLYAPFDVQLGVGAGLRFKALSVRFSYDFGMLDKDNSENGIWKNNDVKIGVALAF